MAWLDDPEPRRDPWWLLAILGIFGGAAGAVAVIMGLSWWWGR